MKPTPLTGLSTSLLPYDSRAVEGPSATETALSIQDILQDPSVDDTTNHDAQLRTLFDALDVNRSGRVTFAQISDLLERDLAYLKLGLCGVDAATATTLLFQKVQAIDDTLSYAQFHDVFCGSCVPSIGNSIDNASTSRQPLETRARVLADWYATHNLRVWWLVGYGVANVVAFWWAFYSYRVDAALQYGLRIARGGAKIAILNAFLVMLPLLRSITQVLKGSTTLWQFVPFDNAMLAHKICGTMCLVGGAIHVGAHSSNLRRVAVFRDGVPPFGTLLLTQPVWTGVVLVVLSLISFPLSAVPRIRQGRFNLFWYSHMLFGVLLLMLCVHDAASWVVRATSYVWIVPAATLYLIERRFRDAKMFTEPVAIVEATLLDRACAVYMEKPRRFVYRPGMYLLLNCPEISYHEWHPFTLSSAPDDNYLSIHMRDAGDWTTAFHKLMAEYQASARPDRAYPVVYLDGPAGAPAEGVDRYATCLCIAGGIGVTPFASIFRDLVHRWQPKDGALLDTAQRVPWTPRKIYFHWSTRAQSSLHWFEHTMQQIHALDRDGVIGAHQYLTVVKAHAALILQAVQRVVHAHMGHDVLSGHHARPLTHVGAPDYDEIFQRMCRRHAGETVGVFSRGPRGMETQLRALCKQYSRRTAGGTIFEYHPERFS